MQGIHSAAIVHPNATVGKNVTIYPHAYIEEDVVIGDNCVIHNGAVLMNGSRLANDVIIHHHAVIANVPQDLKFSGEKTTVEIGERTVIREFVTLNRGTTHSHKTSIGADCLIMAYVHAAHDVFVGDKVILANGVQLAGHVHVGFHATIGGLVPVHQFVKIGDHSFIGGGLRVAKDVPPFILAMGEPLVFGGLNKVGLQRRGFSEDTINLLKKAYRIYYQSNLLKSEAMEQLEALDNNSEALELVRSFIKSSDRGLIGFGRR